ncbi:ornithine cyclodeaminase [Bordetella genomosp. 9]|uniref:ornithine cyclodeaminase family protein n=1 Tax=Bordetella genomosp. 9 TaxID=1416803 RepID=UPI000A294DB4|nr:ornithine cyclodeaminase family protein [Bordetella genomosp. 9]ARP92092.1 ornithine cyclodeaminase [Bordetella genomosp. 9]
MLHISDEMVDAAVSASDAQNILLDAFRQFGQGQAAMQKRERTDSGGVKLSTLGAVIPGQDVVGAKVYTTIQGQFSFVILLFSARDGRPLATFDAAALTRRRTAACSVLAARALARPDAATLGLYGAGTQGAEHAAQMTAAFGLKQVLVHDPHAPRGYTDTLSARIGVPVVETDPQEIAAAADIVVTASRSTTPLFSGGALKNGAFVAAIGSSLPHTRELDDEALRRAARLVVEWKPQSLTEAGDIVLASGDALPPEKIVELAEVLSDKVVRQHADQIFIYKSVGVGLEDIAVAGLAYRRIAESRGLPQP